jgi:hypothetical protein
MTLHSGQKDTFDMPEEYETIIADKFKSREKFKLSLHEYQPKEAKQIILENYPSYKQRFDGMYISLLGAIDTNMLSVDQDSANDMQANLIYTGIKPITIDIKT